MIAALILAASGSLAAGTLHPQHVTLAEAEWNPDSDSLEIALRLTAAQLEEVVERHAGRSVDLDAKSSEKAVAAWLASAFAFVPPDPDPTDDETPAPATLKYVGKEAGITVAWVYFEVPLPNGWEGVRVADAVRLAIEPEQHNTLILSVTRPPVADAGPDARPRKERATYTFDRRTPTHTLSAKDLKPLKKPLSPADAGAPLPASPK